MLCSMLLLAADILITSTFAIFSFGLRQSCCHAELSLKQVIGLCLLNVCTVNINVDIRSLSHKVWCILHASSVSSFIISLCINDGYSLNWPGLLSLFFIAVSVVDICPGCIIFCLQEILSFWLLLRNWFLDSARRRHLCKSICSGAHHLYLITLVKI